ncbi:MAG: Gldg family protein [Gammaproteobacteria bacterium]|nr:Gldg family protein [Gammaproteobacteria bacterium]
MTESRITIGRVGLLMLAALFIVAVIVANLLLRGVRLDLTENRLYTLSDGTYSILEKIPEPINLYFFFSDKATGNVPALRTYANRVRELLQEFEQHAGGKLNIIRIDPLPFSEDEDRASEFGLQGIALGGTTDPVYFGIAGTNSVGDEEILPFLDPSKESFLEYDVAKLIHTLSTPDRPTIGLISGIQITAGFDQATRQMTEPWVITNQISQLFELRTLPPDLEEVDEDVDVLMMVHPKDLSERALYAIDQFILGGGRALIFVDPYAEADQAPPAAPGMPPSGGGSSELNRILGAWGLEVDPENVIGDDRFALSVTGFGNRPVRYLPLFGVDQSVIDSDDVITAELRNLNFGFPGYINVADDAAADVTPLVRTSDLAATIPAASLAFLQDPQVLRDGFQPSGEQYVLAARLQGQVPSAFPDGPPPLPDAGEETPANAGHLVQSADSINVVLIADTDLLTDRLWVQVQNFFGQRLTTAFAGNGDFVVNALDNLTGSGDLISIRGRATYTRPFTRVQELRREADSRFRMTEQALQQELQELETKLSELQAQREDSNSFLLTPEQEAELDRFREERLRIRKELRQVRRDLDQSIEDLGTRLKVINIGLMPLLTAVLGIVVLALRRRQQAART